MDEPAPLGEFLQARRARLRPEDVGYQALGRRRRVRGLRREEIADLAGLSVSYYTRLEQGGPAHASDAVLHSLAAALRLDPHEREHLFRLARTDPPLIRPPAAGPAPVEAADEPARALLAALSPAPALVLGRTTDVLAWNATGHALLAGHLDPAAPDRPGGRPNLAWLTFLDPAYRELYLDWPRKARAVAGNLRAAAGRHPDDEALAGLVAELSARSPEFAGLWNEHDVRPCEADSYDLRHPLVGELNVTQQVLFVARHPDQSVVVVTTSAPASADALSLLGQAVAIGA